MSGDWSKNFLDVMMIALPNKNQAKNNQSDKIIAHILSKRLESKIEEVMEEDQIGREVRQECCISPILKIKDFVLYCFDGLVIAAQCTATFLRSIVLPQIQILQGQRTQEWVALFFLTRVTAYLPNLLSCCLKKNALNQLTPPVSLRLGRLVVRFCYLLTPTAL